MKNIFLLNAFLIIFFPLTILSCSTGKMTANNPYEKNIKTVSTLENGQLIFENELAIIHFDKNEVLKLLEKEMNNKNINKCHEKRLKRHISQIKKLNSETNLFADLVDTENSDYFEVNFQRELINKLVLNFEIAVFNKSKNEFEKMIIYRKHKMKGYCCNTDIIFSNGKKILDTKLFTDNVLIEECAE